MIAQPGFVRSGRLVISTVLTLSAIMIIAPGIEGINNKTDGSICISDPFILHYHATPVISVLTESDGQTTTNGLSRGMTKRTTGTSFICRHMG